MQGSTCYGKEAQAERKEFQVLLEEQQGIERSNWEKILKVCKKQEKEEDRKRLTTLLRNATFGQWK